MSQTASISDYARYMVISTENDEIIKQTDDLEVAKKALEEEADTDMNGLPAIYELKSFPESTTKIKEAKF